jgi:TATA-binding protein-associated factor Taf7
MAALAGDDDDNAEEGASEDGLSAEEEDDDDDQKSEEEDEETSEKKAKIRQFTSEIKALEGAIEKKKATFTRGNAIMEVSANSLLRVTRLILRNGSTKRSRVSRTISR